MCVEQVHTIQCCENNKHCPQVMFMKSISVNKIVKMVLESHYKNLSILKKKPVVVSLARGHSFESETCRTYRRAFSHNCFCLDFISFFLVSNVNKANYFESEIFGSSFRRNFSTEMRFSFYFISFFFVLNTNRAICFESET